MKSKSLKFSLFILCGWIQGIVLADSENIKSICVNDCSQSKNTWLPRSFSSYSMHGISQMQSVCENKEHKLNFSFLTEYMQNFGSKCGNCKNLGSMPFWSGDNTLTIGNNDGRAQLDAYQFGLGNVRVDKDGIAGKIQLNPRIIHVGTDMMMHYQQSKDERGLYFKIHAPLGAMIIDPRLKELSVTVPDGEFSFHQKTTGGSDIDYQFSAYPTPGRRQDSISEAFFGASTEKDVIKGNADKPVRLRWGRIASSRQAIIRLADLSTSIGYNVFVNEDSLVSIGFKGTCATGNAPTADFMLEPIFGRAGAWGVGGEVFAQHKIWENESGTRYLNVLAQSEVLHLLPGKTPSFRSFDLKKNGPGSKYMLVQEYISVAKFAGGQVGIDSEILSPQSIHHAINITTLPVRSKIAVEGSIAVLFDFHSHNWNMAVGGEFWGRSRECLSIDMAYVAALRIPNLNNYAVIGRQLSTYRIDTNNPALVPTYLCEPEAKINKSQNAAILSGTLPAVGAPTTLPHGIKDARESVNRIPANVNDALDIAGAQAARALTGKVTGQVGYTWNDREHIPSIALIGNAEFTNKTNNAIQLWSIALQGTLNF